ncbi:MAG: T9SS type A sorting domain-containing protein [Ignavibacteria bacterium]|nr:T9SS type A sorting domain-containing protein [Ignavibacteria bacterium]
MRKILLTLSVLTLISFVSFTQQNTSPVLKAYSYLQAKGEVYFSFTVFDKARLNDISKIISVDNYNGETAFAYANEKEFEQFIKLNIPFEVLPHPGDADFDLNMQDSPSEIMEWDAYPTYDAYVAMMNQFAIDYPGLCRIVNIGSTVQGRQILYAVISDSVQFQQAEPKVMYTSSMHGDETTGYVLLLRLIHTLLSGYGSNAQFTQLINNTEIWINPLHNPDGTYRSGNSTVNGAIRGNANNIDLNRNYPGTDYYGNPNLQPEIINFMNASGQYYWRLSANFHGGTEVVNYPWDCWVRLAADDAWWIRVSRKFADTVHRYAPANYMNEYVNGITNGYAWYYVHSSRQDYQNYYRHGREVTIEISDTKLLPPAQLPAHWEYLYRSLIGYLEQVHFGIKGQVTDSLTNLPVKAKISISGFDMDSSEVYSDSLHGMYYRMIIAGNYNLTFSAPGYYSKTVQNVESVNDQATVLNVKLKPITTGIANNNEVPNEFKLHQNFPNPFNPVTHIKFQIPATVETSRWDVLLAVYDILGNEIAVLANGKLAPGTYEYTWDASAFPSGVYFYRLTAGDFSNVNKMILLK